MNMKIRKMQERRKISIIVPVYKAERFLPRCIESVIHQTFPDWELILVDDGSPDRCGEICDAYAEKDQRIYVIHQKNFGVSAARNAGLNVAHGNYIYFIDSDDYIADHALEILYNKMEQKCADIVFSGHNRVRRNGEICNDTKEWEQGDDIRKWQRAIIENQIPNFVWGKLYRRSLWKNIRFPAGVIMEDLFIMPHVFMAAKKIHFIREPLYFYSNENDVSIMSVSGDTYISLLYGRFLAWREHEKIGDAYSVECAEYCASKALHAALRALSMNIGADILSEEQEAEAWSYVREHQYLPINLSLKFLRWTISHRDWPLSEMVGSFQRYLVKRQQIRRNKRKARK